MWKSVGQMEYMEYKFNGFDTREDELLIKIENDLVLLGFRRGNKSME